MSTPALASSAPEDRVRIASAVRAHYGAAGLSAAALAREIGMSQSKMSRRTTASEPFDIDELSAIARVIGVSIVDLISGDNLPARPVRLGGGAGRRHIYLLDGNGVGLGGLEPPASTVESRRFNNPIVSLADVRARRAALAEEVSA